MYDETDKHHGSSQDFQGLNREGFGFQKTKDDSHDFPDWPVLTLRSRSVFGRFRCEICTAETGLKKVQRWFRLMQLTKAGFMHSAE